MHTSSPPAVIVIGSINTDMVIKTTALPVPGQTVMGGKFFMSPGGKGGNQAVAAARHGAQVKMIANVGQDMFGDESIQRLQEEGIDCSLIGRDFIQPSGVALISVNEAGENQIVVAPGANDTLSAAHIDEAIQQIPDFSVVLMQLEIPLETVVHAVMRVAAKNCRVILDPAPAQHLPDALLAAIYLITPNETEAEQLTGITIDSEAAARAAALSLLARGVHNVALTLGANGVLLANANTQEIIPAPQVVAVDSTAAGDCFNGSLAAALARGYELRKAVRFGCRSAAISVTRLGAQDSMPLAHELG